jgi:endonuclease YncB( thermonuclease family)
MDAVTLYQGPWRVPGQVLRVVDGDTFIALLDVGWGIFHQPKKGVRVLADGGGAYDAPDRQTPEAMRAATVAARSLLPVGVEVLITSYRIAADVDAFGRTLASVRLPDGRDYAAVMTAAGHVKAAGS